MMGLKVNPMEIRVGLQRQNLLPWRILIYREPTASNKTAQWGNREWCLEDKELTPVGNSCVHIWFSNQCVCSSATAAEYLLTLEGELVPALTIKDSVASPFALQVFSHVLSQLFSSILAGKSQSRGLVVVSFSRSPPFYLDF